MTNFLNRMAVRAMGAITTAQPFVPSVFTPAVGLAGNNAPAPTLPDPTIRGIERGADRARQAPASTRESTLPGEREGLNPTAVSYDTAVSLQTGPLPVFEPAAERLDRPSPFPVTTLPDQPATATATRNAQLQADGISSYTRDQSMATSLGPDQMHPESDQPIADVRKGTVSPPLQTAVRIPTKARPIDSPPAVRGLEPEAPVIRVSIGRIDVRAEFAAATPSPAPVRNNRPATLSLDEYLKQRSEGRR